MKKLSLILVALMLISAFGPTTGAFAADNETAELVLLQTTDLHGYMVPYDYFSGSTNKKGSLARVATLINQYRDENDNVMLFDSGDTIQGSSLAYYWGVKNPTADLPDVENPFAYALEYLDYDAMVLGNHEFQNGLEALHDFVDDADFPTLSCNTVYAGTEDLVFEPYAILDKELSNGETIKVGVLGVTTPGWYPWYGSKIDYEYEPLDQVEAVEKYVPMLEADGADVIVLLSHSGLGYKMVNGEMVMDNRLAGVNEDFPVENAVDQIAKTVPGIDVIMYGHTHTTNVAYITNEVSGDDVLVVQGKQHGRGLSVTRLELEKMSDGWDVVEATAETVNTDNKDAYVEPDADFMEAMSFYHDATVAYMEENIAGATDVEITSRGSRITDTNMIQLITDVQTWAVENSELNTEAIENPILSMAAPFRYGAAGPDDYTDIPEGEISLAGVGNIYLYDDILVAIEISGSDLKAYLEHACQNFNQIVPGSGDMPLINPDFEGYYFDQIDGVDYVIDVTRPLGDRIVSLTYNGSPVAADDVFTLAMNNYRAGGGGNFPGTGSGQATVLYDEGAETRDFLSDYIMEKEVIMTEADHNWTLAPNFLNHWADDYVYDLLNNGFSTADDEGTFDLNGSADAARYLDNLNRFLDVEIMAEVSGEIERDDAIALLADALEARGLAMGDNAPIVFSDVSDADTAEDLAYLTSLGLISGTGDSQFAPNRPMNNAEMNVIFAKAMTLLDIL
ncbi:5'-nucleotidase C-terminal domain-containing protein [Clostridia bacterium]|nr:5'-nucleotidase C-terminal domain-containing protein [Clostridia bacterium]